MDWDPLEAGEENEGVLVAGDEGVGAARNSLEAGNEGVGAGRNPLEAGDEGMG